jgi:dihydrofolate synthase/folylpolyglutamate synthase
MGGALARVLAEMKQLHRLEIEFNLDRVERLLAKLGDPHTRLPPVFHVAGTNGKGSTVAFLRAGLEAAGLRVHVYTSPHLVRFNERIRLAGQLIDDASLFELLSDVLRINDGDPITFFEVTTCAAFLAFARTPADAVVLEVGMGGRLDATNVVPQPAAGGIAQLGLDHQEFLGNTILEIAREKAGIAKRGSPLVLSRYPKAVTARIAEVAGLAGARLFLRGQDWDAQLYGTQLHYKDMAGRLDLPPPRLIGAHQIDNAGLAIAMLRHQSAIAIPDAAIRAGMGWAEWPARLQRIGSGALLAQLPAGSELWLDGGHNPLAGRVLADRFRGLNLAEQPFYLVMGMLTTKDPHGFLKPFSGRATAVYTVPIPGEPKAFEPAALKAVADSLSLPAVAADSVRAALIAIRRASAPAKPPVVLISGSLYLAGQVLADSELAPT